MLLLLIKFCDTLLLNFMILYY